MDQTPRAIGGSASNGGCVRVPPTLFGDIEIHPHRVADSPPASCYALRMLNDAFDANCAALQQIKDAGGDVNVSQVDPDPARKVLGEWISHQRSAQKRNRLSAERITRLEALGVWWSKPRTP